MKGHVESILSGAIKAQSRDGTGAEGEHMNTCLAAIAYIKVKMTGRKITQLS